MDLVICGGVELEDGAGGVAEGGVEGCEEACEAVGWGAGWMGGFGVEKPLDDGYALIIYV